MSPAIESTNPTISPKLHLLLCLGADFDGAYIAHLCRYYTPAVDSWLVLLHSNDLGESGDRVISEARHKFEASLSTAASEATLSTCEWRGEFDSYTKIDRLNDLVRECVPSGEWVLSVDADEFVESPGDLKSLATQCLTVQQKVVYGSLVDRFAPGREPQAIDDQDDLFSKFPLGENYTKTEMRASNQKPCLMIYEGQPLLRDCHNHTGQSERDYRLSGRLLLTLWHFKWIESTRQKLRHRVQSFQRQGLGWWRESAVCLRDIYKEEPPRHGGTRSPGIFNPYRDLEARAFWKSGIADGSLAEIWKPKWRLQPEDRVVTFGSCFARHLGPALRHRGCNWWETEPPPPKLSAESAERFGYGQFSCRTGAITTPTALRQWVSWALGDTEMPDVHWVNGDRFIDPFRPSIEPGGFVSRAEMTASRKQAITSLQRAIVEADVFIFTLGMTESWIHTPGDWVYPACPGTIGGSFDPAMHRFRNLSFAQVEQSLVETLERLWLARPELRVLLTVSPVPLTATASGQHVLAANSHSKAVLRAVAGEVADRLSLVDYFPSYEIVTQPGLADRMYEANRRSVSAYGVARVMDVFFSAHGVQNPSAGNPEPKPPNDSFADRGDCDDAWAEAFAQ